jgi:Domain of unknown function (DUF4410)
MAVSGAGGSNHPCGKDDRCDFLCFGAIVIRTNTLRNWARVGLSCLAIAVVGCAGAAVTPTMQAGYLPKPDMIVVNNFAVTPAEITLDKGLLASAVRDSADGSVTADENKLGHMVADKMAQYLVEELRNNGINAGRANPAIVPTTTTVILHGEFVTIDQGNQSARVWIGFGLGGSELRTRIQAYQNNTMVAAGETSTSSSLKPGMVVGIASGGAGIAIGAAAGGVSEAFLATLDADSKRTAKEVAAKVKAFYVDRGWMPS